MIVTAKGADEEKVRGLDAGADDYVTKPFSNDEIAARVRAILRRSSKKLKGPKLVFRSGELTVDLTRQLVTVDKRIIDLTPIEYRLLSYFVRNSDRVVTIDELLRNVWGKQYLGEAHLLHVNVGRLRYKLGDDPKNTRYLHTKSGIGYTMAKKF
jgi:two-component system KDP operon response regulator KdpE